MASPLPFRNPRPHGQVYFDQFIGPGHPYHQSQQLSPPSGSPPTLPGRRFSVSSPSSYSSTCLSSEGAASVGAFSSPSTPSIFSQESFVPERAPSWVDFPDPRHSASDSDDPGLFPTPPSHNEFSAVSAVPDSYEKFPTARPRRRSEGGGRTERSGQNNRRLIIVDNNLLSRDPEASPDDTEFYNLRRAEVSRLVRSTLGRRIGAGATTISNTPNKETSKTEGVQVKKPPPVGSKERNAVFKVICPDTRDLWKMPVIPGESLEGFAGRVKQKTGGDVILLMDDEVLASEEDWKVHAKGGGRIVAHLIR